MLEETLDSYDLDDKACFDVVCKAVESCFIEPRLFHIDRTIEVRRKFADSDLIKIWVDCSDSFEYSKLRKLILNKCKQYESQKKERLIKFDKKRAERFSFRNHEQKSRQDRC